MILQLSNGVAVNAGNVKGDKGDTGKDGKDGVGISSIYFNNKEELIIKYSNNTENNLGKFEGINGVGVDKSEINSNGELIKRKR